MANKKCLVFETMNNIQEMNIVENASNPNEIRLRGVFGVAGVRNNNNRVYSKDNYGMMVESLQKVIATEGCLGELEHPNSMNIDLNNVSHKIEEVHMNEDGTVTGTILLLDTDKGKNAKAIVRAGVPLYISSRAAGSIDENGNVTLTTLKTYDLVGTPGFSQAKLNLAENQKFESLNESLCLIVEGDDLLGDDDGEEKKDDSKEEKKDDSKEEKKDDEKEEEKKEDDSSDDKKDDDEEDNKNSKDTNMNELKEAIDKLTEKVTNLEAELHVAQESKVINYDAIEKWVTEEFAPEFKSEINNELTTQLTESITNDVQEWVVNDYSPIVQNWVCEEFAPEVQNWITEEFAPEVQNWVCEEFAPKVQSWVCEEFAPKVQSWVCEEFAPTVENWLSEEFMPENNTVLENKINENVSTFIESQKEEKRNDIISNVDAVLASLSENKDAALEILKEERAANKFAGIYAIENMPSQYQPLWNGLNESRQNEIARQTRAYDFTKEGVMESFWSAVDFSNEPAKPVNENVNNVYNKQNWVAAQMQRMMR